MTPVYGWKSTMPSLGDIGTLSLVSLVHSSLSAASTTLKLDKGNQDEILSTHILTSQRLKACRDPSIDHPTRPRGPFSQAWATATAIIREMGHPQYYIPIKGLRWATPLPLGRVIVLACYWVMIVYMMSWQVSKNDVYYWERIGYRNAWVTLMQFPLVYLLSTKVNVIGFLTGSSHERLNWLHRWVARTMFVTATVHGFHFWTMWVRAEFLDYALEIMPLVKYGLAAWAILLWNVITGIVPIRRLSYEVWVAQHVLTSIVMLWLLYRHIPANARWLLWMSISFLVFDRAMRWILPYGRMFVYDLKDQPARVCSMLDIE